MDVWEYFSFFFLFLLRFRLCPPTVYSIRSIIREVCPNRISWFADMSGWSLIIKAISGITAACLFLCILWVADAFTTRWCALILSLHVCVFQHALRLLAFGQLYKVLNMDPLPASKPSPRLLEGVSSVVSVFMWIWQLVCTLCLCVFTCVYVHHLCFHPCVFCVSIFICLAVKQLVFTWSRGLWCVGWSVCFFFSAGGCQKRLRDDVGPDDRDFIKRMKGDFNYRFSCFKDSQNPFPLTLAALVTPIYLTNRNLTMNNKPVNLQLSSNHFTSCNVKKKKSKWIVIV